MSVQATDATLEKRRIGRLGQQFAVVVALKQQAIAMRQMGQQVSRGMAEVSQNPQFCRTVGACQLQRLARVMWNGKRHDLQVPQINGFTVARGVEQSIEVGRTHAFMSTSTHPDRHPVAPRKLTRSSNVVAVLVRDKESIDVAISNARLAQSH